MKHEVVNLGM